MVSALSVILDQVAAIGADELRKKSLPPRVSSCRTSFVRDSQLICLFSSVDVILCRCLMHLRFLFPLCVMSNHIPKRPTDTYRKVMNFVLAGGDLHYA